MRIFRTLVECGERGWVGGGRVARLRRLTRRFGPLPPAFDARRYRLLNPDLGALSDDEASEHYLVHGRAEARPFRPDVTEVARAFARLRCTPDATAEVTFDAYLAQAGLERGLWLDRLAPGTFWDANQSWLDRAPGDLAETVRIFVDDGLQRVAPLSARDAFDPAFHGLPTGAGSASAVAGYRDWLNAGFERGEAPNEARFLEAAVGLTAFPDGFDEAAYRAAFSAEEQPGAGRARALAHLVAVGLPRGVTAGIRAAGAADLLESIGRHYGRSGRPEAALAALDAARSRRALSSAGLHARGDARQALGRARDAAQDYAAAADAPGADARSHVRAVAALAALGEYEAARQRLAAFAPGQSGCATWRAGALQIVADGFEAERAAAAHLRANGEGEAASAALDAALRRMQDTLLLIDPLPPRLPAGRAAIVTLLVERGGDRDRAIERRRRELSDAGWYADVRDAFQPGPRDDAVDWAQAILVAAPAGPSLVHILVAARALGIPVVFDPFTADLDALAGEGAEQAEHAILLRFTAGLCDFGLASTNAIARVLGPLTRSGVCRVVPRGIDPTRTSFLERPWLPLFPSYPTVFCRLAPGQRPCFDRTTGPALARALVRHPGLHAVFEGEEPGSEFAPFADRVRILGDPIGDDANWEFLAGSDLCVDVSSENAEAVASPWLDAATCGVPSLVSAELAERNGLGPQDGVLAAASAATWDKALDRLLADAALRQELGAKARAAILPARRPERTTGALRSMLGTGPNRAVKDLPSLRRVLVVGERQRASNDVGGLAWADVLAAEIADAFVLDVIVGDTATVAGTARLTGRGDAALLEVGTEGAVSRLVSNPALGALMRRVLDRLRPTVVDVRGHRPLSMAAIEAASASGIPYLVSSDTNEDAAESCHAAQWAANTPAEVALQRRLTRAFRGAVARPDETAPRRALYASVVTEASDLRRTIDVANTARDAGNYAEAEAAYERIIAVDPRYHFAHYELAFSRRLRRDHVGALAAVSRLLAFAPADERSRRLAALMLYRIGSHGPARAILDGLEDEETAVLREFGDFLERFPSDWAVTHCAALEARPNYIGAARLLRLTRDALRRGNGFAMVRLGDGEGAFMATDPKDRKRFERLHRANRIDRARVWFGDGADIEGMGFTAQACRIGEIVARTDVVGIPYVARMHLEYGHVSLPGVTAMVDILRAVERDLSPHGHLCSHDIHFELHGAGLLDLIAEQARIGVVACHAALPEVLRRRFGLAVDFYKIPGEKLMAAEIGAEATAGEHFPTVFRAVMRALDRPLDGQLFLVSGGLLGKFYCNQIRSSGGVALDIGSLVDAWLGFQTRPGISIARTRL